MRTKTLLTTAALGVAGLLSASAQVYSVNAVGYVNTILQPGFNFIANPLKVTATGGNAMTNLFPVLPNGSQLSRWDPTIQSFDPSIATYYDITGFKGWLPDTNILNPGEAFFVYIPGAARFTNTFVGEVMQGTLTTALPAGFSMVASQVPQTGRVSTDLGFPVANGDQIQLWDSTGQAYDSNVYTYYQITGFTGWLPYEPTNNVGTGFVALKSSAASWTRNFNVNQ